ncbi:hypothetical protein H5410_013924 [Solanum commersonii]|uniref:Uncharacterized protein n=1 Tax=Solanum commersonii TaxID=4109 RepID=A0A9J5ZPT9_SOLCO|nr:hypothetical protein H5410_013924 [Solanum commersonii]
MVKSFEMAADFDEEEEGRGWGRRGQKGEATSIRQIRKKLQQAAPMADSRDPPSPSTWLPKKPSGSLNSAIKTDLWIQTCKSAPLFEFTIHGLWPSKPNGNTLYRTPPPDMLENVFIHQEDMKVYAVMQADHSLRDKLRTIWPTLKV